MSHEALWKAMPTVPAGGKQSVKRCQCEQPEHAGADAPTQFARRPSNLPAPPWTLTLTTLPVSLYALCVV